MKFRNTLLLIVSLMTCYTFPLKADDSIDDFDKQYKSMLQMIMPNYQKHDPPDAKAEAQLAQYYMTRLLNNPQLLQKHPYYPAFEKELDEIIHYPNKVGFLDQPARYIAEQVHNKAARREFETEFFQRTGQQISLNKPNEIATAILFATWMMGRAIDRKFKLDSTWEKPKQIEEQPGYSKAAFSISKSETLSIFESVLTQLQESEHFPIAQFTSKKFVGTYPRELAHFRADYSDFIPNKGNGAIPIIASAWEDKNNDGQFSTSEIDGLYKPVFKSGESQYLGGFFNPEMKFKVRIFGPDGKEIESFSGSRTHTLSHEPNGYGVYTVSFSLNGTLWQVRQFRLVPDNAMSVRFLVQQGLLDPRKAYSAPSPSPSNNFLPAPGPIPARPNPAPRDIQEAPALPKKAPAPAPKKD